MTGQNEKKAIKAGVWYTVANYLSKGAVYLTIPIFSAFMSKTEIGSYMNINAWLQILLPIFTFEFYSSLTLARYDFEEEFRKYVSSTLTYGLAISGTAGLFLLVFSEQFESLFDVKHYSLVIMVIYIAFFPALQYFQTINMFHYKYKKVAIITFLNLLIPLGLSLLFTFTWQDRLAGRIVGYYLPTVIICLVIFLFYVFGGRSFSFKYLHYALKISFPLIWHALAVHMLATGDRIVITKVMGNESNALYTIAYTVCGIVTILWSSMNSAWSPWCTERMHYNDSESVIKMGKPYVILFSAIMVVVLLVAPEILLVMGGGSGYYEARFVIPPVLVGLVAQFVYSMYVNIEFYYKKQFWISLGTILVAIINILLNLIFIPKFGYVAAGYTTLAGYLMLLLYHYYSVKLSKLGIWYDNKFNFAVVLFFLVLLPFVNLLYNHRIIRYIVLFFYLLDMVVLIWKYREKFKTVWTTFRD